MRNSVLKYTFRYLLSAVITTLIHTHQDNKCYILCYKNANIIIINNSHLEYALCARATNSPRQIVLPIFTN